MDEPLRTPVLAHIGGDAFLALFTQNPLPMWIYDLETLAFLDVNDAVVRRYGYARDEFLRMRITDIRPPGDVPRLLADVQHDRPSLQSSKGWRHVTKGGEIIDVEISSHTLEFTGRPAALVVVHDVTEHKRMEEQFGRLSRAVEQSPAAVVVTDTDEKIVYVNPRFVQVSGYPAEELLGTPTPVLTNLPDAEHAAVLDTLRGGGPWTGELEARTKDGRPYWQFATISVLKNSDGEVTRFVKVFEDITERKRAVDALRESERRTVSFLESLPVGVFVMTADGRPYYANAMAAHILGKGIVDNTRADEFPEIYQAYLAGTDQLYPSDRQPIVRALAGEHVVASDVEIRHPDRTIPLEIWGNPVRDSAGHITHAIVAFYDINDRREAQAQIARQMKSMARRATEFEALLEISRDLAVQHDLPSLLKVIVERAVSLTGASGGFIYLYDAVRHDLEVVIADHVPISPGTRLGIGEGLAGLVAQTREPKVVDRYQEWEHRAPRFVGIPVTSVAEVPMQYRGELVGVLGVAELDGAQTFGDETIRLLSLLSAHAASAVNDARLFAQTEKRLQRLGALRTIDMAITASLDLRVTLSVFLDQATGHLGADAASILLLNPRTQTLEHVVGRGFRSEAPGRTRLRLGQGYPGRAALDRRTIQVPHTPAADPGRPHLDGESVHAYYAAPLVAKGEVRGVLEVFHRSELHVDAEWVEFLEALAGQAAIAIDNATLFTDLKRSNVDLSLAYDTTLEGWSRALDLRDKETEGHTLRVTEVAVLLARALGVPEDEIVHIRRGALLHDIGKMGIPDAILNKPGPLTEAEWAVMRRHPELARDLLASIAYLKPALDIPYCHHEKWDGTGYPRGLTGDQIPLAARIFAVVDVWDALRSDRPYRAALPEDQVIEYLQQQAGKHFDLQIAEVFVHLDLTHVDSAGAA
jgi:PAS domain S-box-containing protein/putative nucleotidyltransferase with HDIG domain